jgi:hypothetical protein
MKTSKRPNNKLAALLTNKTVLLSCSTTAEAEATVHYAVLVAKAPIFQAALSGRFKENGFYHFLDEDSSTISTFASWLYDGKYIASEAHKMSWLEISKLWVFADKYNIGESLGNEVLDALLVKFEEHNSGNISVDTLNWIWENTGPASKLREFYVNVCVPCMTYEYMRAIGDRMDHELAIDMLIRTKRDVNRHHRRPRLSYLIKRSKSPPDNLCSDIDLAVGYSGRSSKIWCDGLSAIVPMDDCWSSVNAFFCAIESSICTKVVERFSDEVTEISPSPLIPDGASVECISTQSRHGAKVLIHRGQEKQYRKLLGEMLEVSKELTAEACVYYM